MEYLDRAIDGVKRMFFDSCYEIHTMEQNIRVAAYAALSELGCKNMRVSITAKDPSEHDYDELYLVKVRTESLASLLEIEIIIDEGELVGGVLNRLMFPREFEQDFMNVFMDELKLP